MNLYEHDCTTLVLHFIDTDIGPSFLTSPVVNYPSTVPSLQHLCCRNIADKYENDYILKLLPSILYNNIKATARLNKELERYNQLDASCGPEDLTSLKIQYDGIILSITMTAKDKYNNNKCEKINIMEYKEYPMNHLLFSKFQTEAHNSMKMTVIHESQELSNVLLLSYLGISINQKLIYL